MSDLATDSPGPLQIPAPGRTGWLWTLVRNAVAIGSVVGLALLLHGMMGVMNQPYPSKVMIDIGIAITLAVSLNIVNGYTGQFAIGHAGFMALGGYAAAMVSYYASIKYLGTTQPVGGILSFGGDLSRYGGPLVDRGELLFVVSCLFGGIVAAVAGLLVGLPSLRLRGDYLAIVTLGFGEIVRVLIEYSDPQVPAAEVADKPWSELVGALGGSLGFNFAPGYTTLFWTYLVAGLCVLAALRMKSSSLGRAYLAIREDEIAAEAMGVFTTRYKVQAFVVSAFFAGLAGALYAHLVPIRAGDLGFMKSFEIVIIIVLGGLGSVSGAILAAVVLTTLPELLRGFSQYRMIVYALLLILMMILRPQGLLGLKEIWELRPVARLLNRLRRKDVNAAA